MSEPASPSGVLPESADATIVSAADIGLDALPGLRFVEDPPGQVTLIFEPEQRVNTPPPESPNPNAPDSLPPDSAGEQRAPRPRHSITPESLRERAAAAGYSALAFDASMLAEAAVAITADEPCERLIARRVDGHCTVEVAPDASIAWLHIEPPWGGTPIGRAEADTAVITAYVTHGIDPAAIDTAVITQADRTEIAHASPPINGEDGRLEALIEVNRSRHPHLDQHGHTDYRDLGAIPYVVAGDPLMRRHPPGSGTPGRSVLGTELPAMPGNEVQFGVDLPHTVISPDDPDLLLADAGGQPILRADGIFIEPLIHLDDVTLTTGNVEFGGSVEVRGDVHTGMQIKAGGDVLVAGTCESVHIHAGGNIVVKGGVIGHIPPAHARHGDVLPSLDDLAGQAADTAHLIAQGNIAVRHVENAFLRAERSIHIDENALNCDLTAIEAIIVGKDGKTGRLMGGIARASDEICCGMLGAPGASQTLAVVGINPLLQHRMQEMKSRLMAGLKQHSDLSKLVKFLKKQPDKAALLEKADITLRKITAEVAQTLAEEREFEGHLQWSDHAQIIAHQRVMDGTRIMIGKRAHYVGEELGPGVFQIQEEHEGLVFAPIECIRTKPDRHTGLIANAARGDATVPVETSTSPEITPPSTAA